MGFDKAHESVIRVFVIVSAPNPQTEVIVLDGHHPTPIFGNRGQRFEPLSFQSADKEFCYALAVSAWIDLVFLTVIWRKSIRAKFDVSFHRCLPQMTKDSERPRTTDFKIPRSAARVDRCGRRLS